MDIKEAIQDIAEDIAMEKFGRDFYDLPSDIQHVVYNEAYEEFRDRRGE